ncbi:hypothetical protein BO94DRAFT_560245 [Aspergillus sclerotioniger CBS 115572]|uniref:Zn(2)-C6 fungal-type domain-containing protein n=1 Tax=Aspergillus sclerotioniger CBS 115572 TaxID=1450535 RepID=A0A317VF14_9EURO|nr:hypothetical protein BO94DRAFT_560245 [Aspergillus sclerotioniger CBS 115572]PWY71791.1 hypothetical protein BO94DRAFT_560245 [Aspergillus sclerotioniger CBS 115572]
MDPICAETDNVEPLNPRKRARRRNRTIHACLECRRRKIKCDRQQPCAGCRAASQPCIYVSSANGDVQFRRRLAQMKEAKDALDEGLVGQSDGKVNKEPSSEESDDLAGDGYLQPTRLAIQDAAYAPDTDDQVDDIGIRLGRMRLGERIRIADEVRRPEQNIIRPSSKVCSVPLTTSSQGSSSSVKYMKSGRFFTNPSVGLVFGSAQSSKLLIDFLSPRFVADKLLERYWVAVHPVARILHRPTFAQWYETMWELVSNGHEMIASLGAIVLAILFSVPVSLDDEYLDGCDISREDLKNRLQLGTETALDRAQLLTTAKTETLQAFVAYILPMCLGEASRAHSVLCMGLHPDPIEYVYPPVECQIRRLICEIQGPRPFIQPDGTPLPTMWNDMVLSMIRFECQEMHRRCLRLHSHVDQKRTSLTKVIAELEAFRIGMDKKHGPLIDGSPPQQPIQSMACLVLKLMVSLLYICLLHRYMDSSWYSSSYHQYHVAFLLLCAVFAFPLRKEATRIWRCLDFVFAEPLRNVAGVRISETLTLQEIIDYRYTKGHYLITTISERMHVYQASKRLRLPSSFDDSMFVITPQVVEDADPTMPLNCGHDNPEASSEYPTVQDSMPGLNSTEQTHNHPFGGIITQLSHTLRPWSNIQPAGSQYSTEVHCQEPSSYHGNLWDTVFPPEYNDGNIDIQGGAW